MHVSVNAWEPIGQVARIWLNDRVITRSRIGMVFLEIIFKFWFKIFVGNFLGFERYFLGFRGWLIFGYMISFI